MVEVDYLEVPVDVALRAVSTLKAVFAFHIVSGLLQMTAYAAHLRRFLLRFLVAAFAGLSCVFEAKFKLRFIVVKNARCELRLFIRMACYAVPLFRRVDVFMRVLVAFCASLRSILHLENLRRRMAVSAFGDVVFST